MTRPSPLTVARWNCVDTLQSALDAVNGPVQADDPAVLAEIAEAYRILGIAVLLEEGDPAAFGALLALSAQCDCVLRALDLSNHPEQLAGSRAEPFCDALVAGDLESARTIARLAPRQHQEGWEYEDDFLRYHFLERLFLGQDDDKALGALLDRWEALLEGKNDALLPVCRALLVRDKEGLEEALQAAVRQLKGKQEIWRTMSSYRAEVDATEGAVYVEGLAVLRLAELRQIEVGEHYELMPALARLPLGGPLPPPHAWRSFGSVRSYGGG